MKNKKYHLAYSKALFSNFTLLHLYIAGATLRKRVSLKTSKMVRFKPVGRKNPQDLAAAKKYYAHAIASGHADLERLARLISNQSTVREADCHAVLQALQHNIIEELSEGKIVQLGSIGSLQVGVNSTGSVLEEEVSESNITKAHLNFRPGKPLKKMLRTLDYKLVS